MTDDGLDSFATAQTLLAREAGLLKHNIEHWEVAAAGIKPNSAKVRIDVRNKS